jgi:ankyrin repeat protein
MGGGPVTQGSVRPEEEKLDLLIENGLDIKKVQPDGNSLLHLAAEHNNLTLAKKALTLGLDVNAKNKEGNAPLQIAALKATDDRILKLLVHSGADTKMKTAFGESIYDLAKENEVLSGARTDLEFLKN